MVLLYNFYPWSTQEVKSVGLRSAKRNGGRPDMTSEKRARPDIFCLPDSTGEDNPCRLSAQRKGAPRAL